MTSTSPKSLLSSLRCPAPPPLLHLHRIAQSDARSFSLNLTLGYLSRVEFRTITKAKRIIYDRPPSHFYLPPLGDPEFRSLLSSLLHPHPSRPALSVQTPSCTAALHLALDFCRRHLHVKRLLVPSETWENHAHIASQLSIPVTFYPYLDKTSHAISAQLLPTLRRLCAKERVAVLFQLCAQNPTGIDPGKRFWWECADVLKEFNAVAIVDAAYVGLGKSFKEDVYGLNVLGEKGVVTMCAVSFSKNLGIYSSRVGGLTLWGMGEMMGVQGTLEGMVRAKWSSVGGEGVKWVKWAMTEGKEEWERELEEIRREITEKRIKLAEELGMEWVKMGLGMFVKLDWKEDWCDRLRKVWAIHLGREGRINLGAVEMKDFGRLVKGIRDVVEWGQRQNGMKEVMMGN